jgi:septal ring factor EnvC (AmiA/AmiB activator)
MSAGRAGRRVVSLVIALSPVALAMRSDGARAADPLDPTPPGTTVHADTPALALATLDRRLADLDTEEAGDKHEIETLGARIAEVHARVIERGKAFYRATRAGMLPLGGGFDAFVAHAMKIEHMRHDVAADLHAETDLRGRAAELARTLERLERDRAALGAQRSALDQERTALEDESRRQQAFDRAFSTSTGATDYVAVYGGGATDEYEVPAGFAASRGRLLFPVAGRAETRPAHREGTDGPGLEVRAPFGTPVRGVFAGRVAFADRYGPYGKIVIVDHGAHYYSVSGNLGEIDVHVGDSIAPGQRLGTVGDDGQGAMLYFEIRHGTETVAPGPWLGLP